MGFRGLNGRGLPKTSVLEAPGWRHSSGSWQPSWGSPWKGDALQTIVFQLNEQILPLSRPARVIHPRVKNEFSQEALLPETLEP